MKLRYMFINLINFILIYQVSGILVYGGVSGASINDFNKLHTKRVKKQNDSCTLFLIKGSLFLANKHFKITDQFKFANRFSLSANSCAKTIMKDYVTYR